MKLINRRMTEKDRITSIAEEMKGEMPVRYWFWGETGTKKTYIARKIAAKFGVKPYLKTCGKTWDSYSDEKIVLIDDVSYKSMEYLKLYLALWMDYYDFRGWITVSESSEEGQVKNVVPKMIDASKYHLIITSRYSPEAMSMDDDLKEKFARIFKVEHFE